MTRYEPDTLYNVNVSSNGRVHVQGCYQGDLHRDDKPDQYVQMKGRDIPASKRPCRICLEASVVGP